MKASKAGKRVPKMVWMIGGSPGLTWKSVMVSSNLRLPKIKPIQIYSNSKTQHKYCILCSVMFCNVCNVIYQASDEEEAEKGFKGKADEIAHITYKFK